jgi:hypothetical protein
MPASVTNGGGSPGRGKNLRVLSHLAAFAGRVGERLRWRQDVARQ